MAIVAVIMCVNFAACSDDDDEDTPNNPLIGTWKEDVADGEDYLIWKFNADGTGSGQEYYRGTLDEQPNPFTYTYDSKTSILIITEYDPMYGNIDSSFDVTIDGNTMITKDREYGDEMTWKKTK